MNYVVIGLLLPVHVWPICMWNIVIDNEINILAWRESEREGKIFISNIQY